MEFDSSDLLPIAATQRVAGVTHNKFATYHTENFNVAAASRWLHAL
jgi:hypothetical protein